MHPLVRSRLFYAKSMKTFHSILILPLLVRLKGFFQANKKRFIDTYGSVEDAMLNPFVLFRARLSGRDAHKMAASSLSKDE